MKKPSINIARVAAEAGVGVGTVSRVLNDSDQVSDATRERVLRTAARLNYRPLRSASSLSRGRTGSVGLLVSDITRPSVVERLVGVIDVLNAAGLDAVVMNAQNRTQLDHHLVSLTDERRVDGIIVISIGIAPERVARIRELAIPLVLIDGDLEGLPRVCIDDVAGGQMAAEHLVSLGHRRIGFLSENSDIAMGMPSSESRYQGYLRALDAADIEPDFDLVVRGPHSSDAAAALTTVLLGVAKDRPTAICASSDTIAVGVIKALHQLGRDVPGDCAVIGFDDIEIASILDLSTIRQPLLESGARGASMMVSLLDGASVEPLREELALEVIPRASSIGTRVKLAGVPRGDLDGNRVGHILQRGGGAVS
ncbi:MAG TPA: LacI family DNA-binding transcriptional regulator [Acidimicrobiales bacterium]